jgi:hypothetical protein
MFTPRKRKPIAWNNFWLVKIVWYGVIGLDENEADLLSEHLMILTYREGIAIE